MKTLVPNRGKNKMMDFLPSKAPAEFNEATKKQLARGATASMVAPKNSSLARQLVVFEAQRKQQEEQKVEEVPPIVSPADVELQVLADNGGTGDQQENSGNLP